MPFTSAFEATGFDTWESDEEDFGNRYFYNPNDKGPKNLDFPDFFWPTEDETDKLLELEFLNEDEAEEESKSELDEFNILDGTPGTEPEGEEDKKYSKEDDSSESKTKKSRSFLSRILSGMFGWMF